MLFVDNCVETGACLFLSPNSRLGHDKDGGAWCPQPQVSTEVEEWLEIKLNGLKLITAVETQGRFGNGRGLEYTENYRLQYWRPAFNQWRVYKTRNGSEVSVLL
jgi:discoidin domain receptor family protein 2